MAQPADEVGANGTIGLAYRWWTTSQAAWSAQATPMNRSRRRPRIREVGHRGAKHEFPDTESCAEVGDTRVPGHAANVYAGGRMEVDAGGQEVE
jgi:hypothetical protein